MKTGIVFGVFDGLHEGHKAFLSQACSLCDELVVVLTRDETAETLKGRLPKFAYPTRAQTVSEFLPAARLIPSDSVLGAWSVFEGLRDFEAFLGYDQDGIALELDRLGIPYRRLDPFRPEKYKSSILNR
ncbi:MAG: adenylyltransferase/cytidyltransferase family protein [Candidatus Taylorbacteria bacterium]|nr:adenylyltransferase/cytidyltransferase family protein [Candidatus Taylorbacteria bacterium]